MVRTEVDNLREVKQLEEKSTLEQEYAQAKLELEVERAVHQERHKWQEIKGKLISELVPEFYLQLKQCLAEQPSGTVHLTRQNGRL